jgi:hypothetical protein
MSRSNLWILISLVAVIVGAAVHPQAGLVAAQQDAVATLSISGGTAAVTPQNGSSAQTYARDDVAVVNLGDQIAISDDGEGLLTFFEGTETRLAAGTVITVEHVVAEDTTKQVSLSLTVGQAASTVGKLVDAESRFEINTPAATITVRGTQFLVFARPNQLTQVATLDGTVAVNALDQTVEVPSGFGVKVVQGEAPGTVSVWGLAQVNVSVPEGLTAENLPVTFANTDNGQLYYYRAGDTMPVVVGPYQMTVNIPAPYRQADITFQPSTEPQPPQQFDVKLGALILNLDSEAGNLVVNFSQGDLSGETTVAPGDPILAAPGTWTVQVAQESAPEQVQQFEITIQEDQALTVDLKTKDFGSP